MRQFWAAFLQLSHNRKALHIDRIEAVTAWNDDRGGDCDHLAANSQSGLYFYCMGGATFWHFYARRLGCIILESWDLTGPMSFVVGILMFRAMSPCGDEKDKTSGGFDLDGGRDVGINFASELRSCLKRVDIFRQSHAPWLALFAFSHLHSALIHGVMFCKGPNLLTTVEASSLLRFEHLPVEGLVLKWSTSPATCLVVGSLLSKE
ncbi:hypothetical protein HRR85_005748 [Exophiala dermatitidis]|nr:hypothetical protein HRR85_005748 [Exophiala dermatitidis]